MSGLAFGAFMAHENAKSQLQGTSMSVAPSPSFLKVIGLLLLFSLAPGTLYVLYTRTGGPESKKELAFQKKMRYALMSGSETLDLAPLTVWPWIKVCALDSGITETELTALTGFEYEHFGELHWLHLADHWTLLFVDSEREANWGMARPVTPVRIPRKELADLALPPGVKGRCVNFQEEIGISRREVPVGTSPIVVRFDAAPEESS
jgi:hypothetical protein